VLAQARQHLLAAEVGEHEVEQHEGRPGGEGSVESLASVVGHRHVEPFGDEAAPEERGDASLVLDDQDVHSPFIAAGSPSRLGP